MKTTKSNINQLSFDELLKEAYRLHFEACQICNTLTKQAESENGMTLKTLKDMRAITKSCQKLDQRLRVISLEKSKAIHEVNAEKWSKKDTKANDGTLER
jgi:hypothetical protein